MPNKDSAKQRVRLADKQHLYNRFWSTRCKTVGKRVIDAVEGGDAALAVTRLNEAQSIIDKAVVKGVMHRNTAARRKARLARLVASVAPKA